MTSFPAKKFAGLFLPLAVLLTCCNDNVGQQPAPPENNAAQEHRLDSTVLIRDLAYLSDTTLAGRETGTPGNAAARAYIVRRFDSLDLQKTDTVRTQPFPLENKTGYNVIGTIRGTAFPDQYIVLSAHYDHLGKKGKEIYAGADDNASGSACLLALAAYFRQFPPKHSLVFAAFDAEEKGLQGSSYFVEHPTVELKKIILNINMDMVSRNDQNEIYLSGTHHYPFLRKYADSVKTKTTVKLTLGHDDRSKGAQQDWTNQSDHFPFHRKNIPFLYFGVEDHPDYHRPSDTFEKINKQFYYQVCNLITEMVLLIDKQEKLQ